MKNRLGLPVVGLLLFSGFCALVFQIAWFREFRLVFGASTPASAAVLAIFMGGLGLGNWLLGRYADRHPHPLLLYGQLELLIAVTAAISPWLVDFVRWLYIAIGGQMVLGAWGAAVVRLLLSSVVMALPTFLMGGTLPAASRAVTRADDATRRDVALLYGINTLGAVLGAAVSSFYLLEHFGTRTTLWIACGINLLTGLTAVGLAFLVGPSIEAETELPAEAEAAGPQVSAAERETSPVPPRFAYAAAAVVGFAFFVMELVWFRMLGPLLGGSTFTFGLILVVALLGIGLGGAAYTLIFRDLRPTLRGFALSCGLEAFFIALPYALGDRIAVLTVILKDLGVYGFYGEVVGWLAITSIVILPAAIVAGVQFPMLIALLGSGNRDVGRQVGLAVAFNTLGAIAGSLAGGFVLLPLLTALATWCTVVAILALLGLAAMLLSLQREGRPATLLLPLVTLAGALFCLQATGPTAVWRHAPIGAGRAELPSRTRNGLKQWMNTTRRGVIWEAEGRELSVALSARDSISFLVNGKSDGNVVQDANTQIMLGLVGAILHPDPKQCLVVGLGTGESAGWLCEVPEVEQVDIVELEPVIAEVARHSKLANHDVLNHPKANLIFNDAREVLLSSPRKYDLIASEPSNPYRAGVASLFTREFYAAARNRLNEDGLFLQWLQAYEIDANTVSAVLATLRSEFPHVEVWQTQPNDLLLVCGRKPIEYPVERLRARVAREPFRSALLVAWRATDLEGFLARFVADRDVVNAVSEQQGERLNYDDHNFLEYGSARAVGRSFGFSIEQFRQDAVERDGHRPPVDGEVDWERVEDGRLVMHFQRYKGIPPANLLNKDQKARAEAFLRFRTGDMKGTVAAWKKQSRPPEYPTELAVLALAYAEMADSAAEPLLEQLAKIDPVEADAIRAFLLWRQKKPDEATAVLEKVLIALRTNPWPEWIGHIFNLSVSLAKDDRDRAQRLFDALEFPLAVYLYEESRRSAASRIARGLGPEVAVGCVESYEPNVLWTPSFLRMRYEAYKATGHPLTDVAKRDLDEYERHAPNDEVFADGERGLAP